MSNEKLNLKYIGSVNEPIFVNHEEMSSWLTISGGAGRLPKWGSNAKFEHWAKQVEMGLDVSSGMAVAMLTTPHDVAWVVQHPRPEIFNQVQEVGPYQDRFRYIKMWAKGPYQWAAFEWFYFNSGRHVQAGVSSLRELKRLNGCGIFPQASVPDVELVGGKATTVLSRSELLELKWGNSHATYAALAKKHAVKYQSVFWHVFEEYSRFLKGLDVTPLDVGYVEIGCNSVNRISLTVGSLVSGGMKPVDLFPGLTKKEAHKVCQGYYNTDYSIVDPYSLMVFLGEINAIELTSQSLISEAKTITVARWGIRNIHRLEGTRIVHGPNGTEQVFHEHEILKVMDDDMLPRGERTGWKHVQEQVEMRIKEEMDQRLNQTGDLPKAPFHIVDPNIVQIHSGAALQAEGESMNHCVGGYVTTCAEGTTYIYHVNDGSVKGATAEVNAFGRLIQCRGYGNGSAPLARDMMEAALQKHFNKEEQQHAA